MNIPRGIVQEIEQRAVNKLIRRGMGDAPMTDDDLDNVIAYSELYRSPELVKAMKSLRKLIDHLKSRIALLVNDNDSWGDGYRRGLEDGIDQAKEHMQGLFEERRQHTVGRVLAELMDHLDKLKPEKL